jgi:ATPase subunit of ABC transporter with duplicated ATPase domains
VVAPHVTVTVTGANRSGKSVVIALLTEKLRNAGVKHVKHHVGHVAEVDTAIQHLRARGLSVKIIEREEGERVQIDARVRAPQFGIGTV